MKSFENHVKVPRGTLKHQLMYILNKQYEFGKGRSRHADKHTNGSGHAQLDRIASKNSWIKHKSAINKFAEWAQSMGIKHYDAVNQDDVEAFLYGMEASGLVQKTLAGYQTALNHALAGNGREDHPQYSIHKLGITGVTERQNNLFDKERPPIPDKYMEQVELAQATGLRRTELAATGTKSFYQVADRYYVITIGKGGRPRYNEVNKAHAEVFRERYSDYIVKLDSVKQIPNDKRTISTAIKGQKALFDEPINKKYSIHIYRAEYAIARYHELKRTGAYRTEGAEFEVNGFTGDRGLFREISRNLGHERVDTTLLGSYLRTA